MIMGAC